MIYRRLIPVFALLTAIALAMVASGYYRSSQESGGAAHSPNANNTSNPSATATNSPTAASLMALAPPTQDSASPPVQELEARLQAMRSAWTRVQSDIELLHQRVAVLEQQGSATAAALADIGKSATRPRPITPEDRHAALVAAGVAQERAAELLRHQSQQELERLELRDMAMREGWFGNQRYRKELERINRDALDLRAQIGTDAYDRFLYAAGKDNRVWITSVIPGSVAEEAGLQPGDLVQSYGGNRILRYSDLSGATTQGERDELVPILVRRGESILELWLPRGPLGVHLDQTSVDPAG